MTLTPGKRKNIQDAYEKISLKFSSLPEFNHRVLEAINNEFMESDVLKKNVSTYSNTLASMAFIFIAEKVTGISREELLSHLSLSEKTYNSNVATIEGLINLDDIEKISTGKKEEMKKKSEETMRSIRKPNNAASIIRGMAKEFKEEFENRIRLMELMAAEMEKSTGKERISTIRDKIRDSIIEASKPFHDQVGEVIDGIEEMKQQVKSLGKAMSTMNDSVNNITGSVGDTYSKSPVNDEGTVYHVVFVDLVHLFSYAYNSGEFFGIDWLLNKIKESLVHSKCHDYGFVIGRIYVHTGIEHLKRELESKLELDANDGIVNLAERFTWHKPTENVPKIVNGRQETQDVDTYMVFDAAMVLANLGDSVKSFHLASGDIDMLPILDYTRQKNIHTLGICYKKALSHHLHDYMHKVTWMDSY